MKYATCHPDRQHASLGLCNACYCRQRYAKNPLFRERVKAKRVRYYRAHREQERARALSYYERNAAEIIRKQCEYQRRLEVVEHRKEKARERQATRRELTGYRRKTRVQIVERPPKPAVIAVSDKEWWRDYEKPRRWLLEAA